MLTLTTDEILQMLWDSYHEGWEDGCNNLPETDRDEFNTRMLEAIAYLQVQEIPREGLH